MAELQTVAVYIDYKSPYAYLAKDLVYELERGLPVRIDWLPYGLDIPSFLGSARVDASGRVLGLMPHPERHVLPTQHPRWTRLGLSAEGDGLRLFRNAVQFFG